MDSWYTLEHRAKHDASVLILVYLSKNSWSWFSVPSLGPLVFLSLSILLSGCRSVSFSFRVVSSFISRLTVHWIWGCHFKNFWIYSFWQYWTQDCQLQYFTDSTTTGFLLTNSKHNRHFSKCIRLLINKYYL